MATMLQSAAQPQGLSQGDHPADAFRPDGVHLETSLATASQQQVVRAEGLTGEAADDREMAVPPEFSGLPVGLVVAVPVRDFRVLHLLRLADGEVIETQWGHGEDLPLGSGDVQLAWSEFEVVDSRLAVRITRLA